jgi:hypothetical protein
MVSRDLKAKTAGDGRRKSARSRCWIQFWGCTRPIYRCSPASRSRRPQSPRNELAAALASHLYDANHSQDGAKRVAAVAEGSCTLGATIPSMPRETKHRRRAKLGVATSEETEKSPGSQRRVKKLLSGL